MMTTTTMMRVRGKRGRRRGEEEEEETDQRLENQDKAFTVKSSRHPADSCIKVAEHLHAPDAFITNATSSENGE
jgi:hypothetical protein